ncbi:hypothetical protein IFR23_02105 [Sphingomonas sp. CFBP 13603]|uniref:hypothetical protein n=1 Tax=Sphingomonas sp. CFBP 13603 TaxID=2774040 RepID=UPI001865D0F6|nr:hypothetical protein [Sphingomonas sp. CFBP 13603]MBE2990804.1 hypothetical protein [Sphingomonas sp. CFBP 13603]
MTATANSSFAAEASAEGPMTLAPPSFDGHGWRVVINLARTTAVGVGALMFAVGACSLNAELAFIGVQHDSELGAARLPAIVTDIHVRRTAEGKRDYARSSPTDWQGSNLARSPVGGNHMRGLGGVTIGTDPHINSECVRPNCFVYGLTLGCLRPGKPLIFMK